MVGPLTARHRHLITVLEVARVETFLRHRHGCPGRPPAGRAALARAFMAKAVFGLASTELLVERLAVDKCLRRLCGWERAGEVPTFSPAFLEFATIALPSRLHAAVIEVSQGARLIGHISRDSTAIRAREKPRKVVKEEKPKRQRGHPRKGEEQAREAKPVRRLERQPGMSLEAMLADLPRHCATGGKRNSKGHSESWRGYKLHIDVADGDIPISCLLTSASLHDSQAAIPLATMTARRVDSLHDLMDSACDAPEIKAHSRALGHVPIIDTSPRGSKNKQELTAEAKRKARAGYKLAEQTRYNQRTAVERVNGRLKDDFGGNTVRVRGHDKVNCHLMFGIRALTINQLMRLIIQAAARADSPIGPASTTAPEGGSPCADPPSTRVSKRTPPSYQASQQHKHH